MNPIALIVGNPKAALIGAVVCLLCIYIAVLKGSLAHERRVSAKWKAEAVQAGQMLETQNEAIAELQRISEAKRKAAARALADARKVNAAQRPRIAKLRESAKNPAGACVISETLRQVQGL